MMLVSMILDPEACISNAGFFSVGRTNGRTDKAILGVGYVFIFNRYFVLVIFWNIFKIFVFFFRSRFSMISGRFVSSQFIA